MAKDIVCDINNDYLLKSPESLTEEQYVNEDPKVNSITTIGLIIIALTFVIIWLIQYLWRRRYLYYHSWNIPGPFSLPFVGAAYLFLTSKTTDIMETLLELQKNYPDVYKVWFGPKLYYMVSKPEHIEKILTSQKALDKDYLYKFVSYTLGEGLLTARGHKWKKHRKAIMPAFNQKILDKFQVIFAKQALLFADNLQKEVNNKDLDMFTYVTNCTLDVICETAYGIEMNSQLKNLNLAHYMERVMEITTYRIFHIWHHLVFTWNWYPMSKEYDQAVNLLKNVTTEIVQKKLEAYREKTRRNSLVVEKDKIEDPSWAFLDLIIENSKFTEKELIEEVDLFLVAGTDTTAFSLCCIFVMLGMHQDVQQKVLEEVLDIMGPDRIPLPDDLPHMKYTERVIKESLRLFPVASFFARKVAEDISVEDMVYPAGCSVYFGSVYIHRNPKYWPDPLKFDPDRFLPENVAKRNPCAHIPFSYGPRNCIGGRYAVMNIKTILAIVIRRFKFFTKYKSVEEIKLKTNLVLRLADGPKVWVEERT